MPPPVYTITLHHLAADAASAGLQHPDQEQAGVPVEKLRVLLTALGQAGAKQAANDLSSPEIRIKTPREPLRVRPGTGGRLRLVTWDTKLGGMNFTVDEVIERLDGPVAETATTAAATPARRGSTPPVPAAPKTGMSTRTKIAILAVLIVGINAVTAWFLVRPAPTLLGDYSLMSESDGKKLLVAAAGEYETGAREGDRRLIIQPDGGLILSTYGVKRKIIEETTLRSRAAQTKGKPALLTSDPYLLEVQDANTVILYGNAYRRRQS